MMMSDDKKKMTSVILGKMKPESEAPGGDEVEVDSSPGHMAAAEEILSAVKSNDAASLKNALKSFYDMCASEDYEAPSED